MDVRILADSDFARFQRLGWRRPLDVPVRRVQSSRSPAWAADPTNLAVFNDVSKTVQRYAFFTIFDSVRASVAEGVVTLSGKVTMPYKASDIEKRVAKVDGVTQVVNDLEVLPVSLFDK